MNWQIDLGRWLDLSLPRLLDDLRTLGAREVVWMDYGEWELHLPIGHLNRIAVHPDEQGQGIGRVLLSNVVHTVWRSGVEELSLNTQRHNRRARRLYDAFGFRATGDVAKVWTLRV